MITAGKYRLAIFILFSDEVKWDLSNVALYSFLLLGGPCLAAFTVFASNIVFEFTENRIARVFPLGKIVSIEKGEITSSTISRDRYGNFTLVINTKNGEHIYPIRNSLKRHLE